VDVRNDWNIGPKRTKGSIVIGMRTMFLLYSSPMTLSPCTGGVVAVAGLVVHPMVVCIGSDCLDDVFRCLTFWGWCGSFDGDVCADGCIGAAVVGGGVRVERYVKRSCGGVRSEV